MSLWSAEQREWLQALGHDLLELALVGGASALLPASVAGLAAVGTSKTSCAVEKNAGPDALMRALLKAARRQSPTELAPLVSDSTALPRDPAAKRALWPRLRALRKQVPAR